MVTYLCPRDIWCNDEFHIPVPKDPQDHLPQVPLVQPATRLEELGRRLLLSGLILGPRLAPIPHGLALLILQLLVVLSVALREESREDEDGLDA